MSRDTSNSRRHDGIFWGRLQSFRYAGRGVAFLLRTQPNAWIHGVMTVAVVAAGLLLGVSTAEWCWLVLAIAAVWTAESFNTALEIIVDLVCPDDRPAAGRAKDIGAGAVLLCSAGAAAVGLIVFVPRALALLGA